jgi:hypothetical protein
MLFAEIASCQMEYKYLAHLTGRAEYFTKVCRGILYYRDDSRTESFNIQPFHLLPLCSKLYA